MAPRKFYCHYCDVRLPHNRDARQRHSAGQNHIKNRNTYYHQFEPAAQKMQLQQSKEKCRQFSSSNGCSYGDACVYSHVSPSEMQALQSAANREEIISEFGPLPCQELLSLIAASSRPDASLEEVLLERLVQQKTNKLLNLIGAKVS